MTDAAADPTVLGDAAPGDAGEEYLAEDLGSGFLSETSRGSALAAALPFVATYFARSDTLQLRPTPVVGQRPVDAPGRQPAAHDPILAALRLRAALVAGRRLAEVLRVVLRSANFRYELVREQHVGHLHGRLDVPRYLRERGRRDVPRRYPVIDVQRSSATPENVLAAFALRWLLTEIDTCVLLLRPHAGTPEAREATQIRAELARLGTHPTLRGAAEEAATVARRESIGRLLDTVETRIRAGHVTRAGGYEQLAEWVRGRVAGEPLSAPGDLAVAFYGSQFDNKLFELWCLAQTAAALTRLLGSPRHAAPHLLVRDPHTPVFVWDAGADVIELFFQPSLADLVGAPNRWRYGPSNIPLRGFPDLGLRSRHVDGTTEVVLLDAKLRRRSSARGQEIYKLLGYVANAGTPVRLGALIFHEPDGFHGVHGDRHTSLERGTADEPGRIDVVAVDPTDVVGTPDAFAILARLVVTASGVPADQVKLLTTAGAEDPEADVNERDAARAQALAVAQLQHLAGQLPSQFLEATAAHLRTLLEETWPQVGADVQRMITSAVHFGVTAPDGADLAGPVLGLCAPLERLLRDRLATPALASIRTRPGCEPERWTLGTLLVRLAEAITAPGGRATRELRAYLLSNQVDLAALDRLVAELDELRSRHRNKAAHQGLVERPQWNEVYRLVLRADHALLHRLIAILPSA